MSFVLDLVFLVIRFLVEAKTETRKSVGKDSFLDIFDILSDPCAFVILVQLL